MTRAVVPISQIARRIPLAGRIRIGVRKGKAMAAIDTFRFTSPDQTALEQIAALYGGTVKPWSDPKAAAGQYEVITDANIIPIALPPDPLGGTPSYELWTGGGRARNCDGETCEMLVQGQDGVELQQCPCICWNKNVLECKLTVRLSVLLPEVRFVGVWRLDTKSHNAAEELPGMVELIRSLQDRGIVRGLLRIESRRQVIGGKTNLFKVPVLGVDETVEALAAGAGRMAALGSAVVPPAAELGAGSTDGGGTAAQVTDAPRESAPVESASPSVDLDDEVVDAELVEEPPAGDACPKCHRSVMDGTAVVFKDGVRVHKACVDEGPDSGAMKRLHGLLKTNGISDAERHRWASERLGRKVDSFTELSGGDVDVLIDLLTPAGEPA